jgi:hypothetical protein
LSDLFLFRPILPNRLSRVQTLKPFSPEGELVQYSQLGRAVIFS